MTDLVGKTISHYRILEKLSEGGMGVVYKAEDTKLKRTIALKFLTSQALGAEEEKTRFIHEAQAAGEKRWWTGPPKKMEDNSAKVSSYPADPIENMRIMIYDR